METLAFLQSWLFFGLLREAFGDRSEPVYKYWVSDYEDNNIDSKHMMSPYLPKYLDIISERLSDKSHRPPWTYWDEVLRTTLQVAESFENTFEKMYVNNEEGEEPVSLRIIWSILTLGQMISIVTMEAYGLKSDDNVKEWPDSAIVIRRLENRGWCPNLIARLRTTLSMDVLYFLTLMPWPHRQNPYSDVERFFAAQPSQNSGISQSDAVLEGSNGNSNLSGGTYKFDSSSAVGTQSPPVSAVQNRWEPPSLPTSANRHQWCSFQICRAAAIDYDLYRTEHVIEGCHCGQEHTLEDQVIEGCNCGFMGPEMEKIYTILDRRLIPVIKVDFLLDDKGVVHLELDVSDSQITPEYVAISHVWADGLGNQTDNKLPLCQLFQIIHLARKASKKVSIAVWIDTLCVPRDRSQRGKALDLMNDTYRLSERVLVLDANLRAVKAHPQLWNSLFTVDVEFAERMRMGIIVDLLLRISCCPWTTRLWTLPEGQVGERLYFQFADQAIEIGDLFLHLHTWPFIGTSLVNDLRAFLVRLRPRLRTQAATGQSRPEDPALLRWPDGSLGGRFIAMLHAIEWRHTSREVDQVLCMAIQLKLDVPAILRIPEEDHEARMRALYVQLPYVPSDLMFTHGLCLTKAPFRSAPRHLLNYKNDFSFIPAATPDTRMARQTEVGLQSSYKSFEIELKPMPRLPFLYFRAMPVNAQGYARPRPDYFMKPFGVMLDSPNPAAPAETSLISWHESGVNRALVGEKSMMILLSGRAFHGHPALQGNPGEIGLIVKCEGRESNMIYVTPLLTVVVYEINEELRPMGANVDVCRAVEYAPRKFCVS